MITEYEKQVLNWIKNHSEDEYENEDVRTVTGFNAYPEHEDDLIPAIKSLLKKGHLHWERHPTNNFVLALKS